MEPVRTTTDKKKQNENFTALYVNGSHHVLTRC